MTLHDAQIELSVLSGFIYLKDALAEHADRIKPDHFHEPAYRDAYAAMFDLTMKGESHDLLNLRRELVSRGKKDVTADLISQYITPERMTAYVNRLVDMYQDRELTRYANTIAGRIAGGEAGTLEFAIGELGQIADNTIKNGAIPFTDFSAEIIKEVEAAKKYHDTGETRPGSLVTGIHSLDALTGGFRAGEMAVIAARPAMGKSTFARQLVRNAARNGVPCCVISREMGKMQIGRLMASSEAAIDSMAVRDGKIIAADVERFRAACGLVGRWPLYIDDTSSALHEIVISVKKWRMRTDRTKPAIVVVDYLQLVHNDKAGRNRENEVSEVSRAMKTLAMSQNILVLALSQLSREVEKRADRKPMLADLRESGAIEQDADQVLFLYRPEVYGFLTDEEGNSTQNLCQLIVAKSRESAIGTIPMFANMSLGNMGAWDQILYGVAPDPRPAKSAYDF